MSVHRRRLSDEGEETGLSRKQRQDRRKQRVRTSMHYRTAGITLRYFALHDHSVEHSQALSHDL